jgi:allantoin racemase
MEKEPKILVLLPFRVEGEEFVAYNRDVLFPAGVDIKGLQLGYRAAETFADTGITMREELREMVQAEKDGYDAVVIGCYLDPGLREGRELLNIPVFGVANTSLHVCAMLGYKIGIVTPTVHVKRGVEMNLREWGLDHRCAVRAIGTTVEEFLKERTTGGNQLVESMVEKAVELIRDEDVNVLTIGCGGTYWAVEAAKRELISRGYGNVPFVSPHKTAVEVVRALLKFKDIKHSKSQYPYLGGYQDL